MRPSIQFTSLDTNAIVLQIPRLGLDLSSNPYTYIEFVSQTFVYLIAQILSLYVFSARRPVCGAGFFVEYFNWFLEFEFADVTFRLTASTSHVTWRREYLFLFAQSSNCRSDCYLKVSRP